MAYATNSNLAEIAIAKQSAETTTNTTPTYSLQVFGGRIKPVVTYNEINVTDTSNALPMVWKGIQNGILDATIPAFPASIGTFLKGILPTDTKTGSGDPYTHTFDPSGTAIWNTLFSTMPGSLYETFTDTVISGLVFEFGDDKLLKVHATGQSRTSSRSVSAYTTPTTANIISPTAEFFHTNGATFKFTLNATPATDTVLNVASGTIEISRPVTPVPTADTIAINYFNREKLNVVADLNLVFVNWQAYLAAFYGGVTGTTPDSSIPSASLDFTFPCLNSVTHTLQIKMPWLVLEVDPPDPDPAGGPLFVHAVGRGIRPTSGDLVSVVLLNAVSSAY